MFEKHEAEALLESFNSPVRFVNTFLSDINDKQIEWLSSTESQISLGSERASRRTTTMLYKALWTLVFKSNSSIVYISNNYISSVIARDKIIDLLNKLPLYARPKICKSNKTEISFDNGSKIYFATYSPRLGRGHSLNLVLLDNSDLVKTELYTEVLHNMLPLLSLGNCNMMEAR